MIHLTNTARLAVVIVAAGLTHVATAATLSFDATMHVAPNDNAEVVGTLPAGASVTPLLREDVVAAGFTELPPGWIAVQHATTIEGYVRNKDVGKDFAMKPDSPFFAEPAEGSPMLATVGPMDPVETGDPVGRFSRATLRKNQIVFLNSVPPGSRAMTGPQSNVSPAVTPSAPTAPSAPAQQLGTPQPKSAPATITAAPRSFEGYLMRTRRILGHGPKLDYQLVDENNRRIALLDMSALLVTEPIEFFEGRLVKIYGPGMSMEGVTEAIIRVENLRLAR